MTGDVPLVFECLQELRHILTRRLDDGGVDALTQYVTNELIEGRNLQIGADEIRISAVLVRHLDDGNPADVILDYGQKATPQNSRLALTINLRDTQQEVQLVVRSRLDQGYGRVTPKPA